MGVVPIIIATIEIESTSMVVVCFFIFLAIISVLLGIWLNMLDKERGGKFLAIFCYFLLIVGYFNNSCIHFGVIRSI